MSKRIIIAIDGPAGSGKSVTAKKLAEKLGIIHLDTGAMYRAATLLALRNKVIDQPEKIVELLRNSRIEFKQNSSGEQQTYLNGENVSAAIRSKEVNSNVSEISIIPGVRNVLVELQRKYGEKSSLVAEGRDIGTAVFPNANLKIFLTANPETRAKRRFKEMIDKGENAELNEIKENVLKRDKIDSEREINPLRKAEDAVEIDTTNLTIETQIEAIAELAEKLL